MVGGRCVKNRQEGGDRCQEGFPHTSFCLQGEKRTFQRSPARARAVGISIRNRNGATAARMANTSAAGSRVPSLGSSRCRGPASADQHEVTEPTVGAVGKIEQLMIPGRVVAPYGAVLTRRYA